MTDAAHSGLEAKSALDAELDVECVADRPEDWREKVAIAKEARELGERTHPAASGAASYGLFPAR